jgi:hypothetical protein
LIFSFLLLEKPTIATTTQLIAQAPIEAPPNDEPPEEEEEGKPTPSKDSSNAPKPRTEIDELETNQNPLMPAGDSLDKIINSKINDDLWQKMLGDMPCMSTQEACIKQLQTLAVQNSRELKAIDERIEAIKARIEESKANNQASVRLGVFEPLLQSWLKTEDVKQSDGTTRKRGFLDNILGALTSPISGVNEVLGLIGLPLFKNMNGGDAAAQSRVIAIGDLQVKLAEIENKRGDIAAKLRETVVLNVLEFDQARREFQIGQEIAKRETARMAVRKIEYQLGGGDTASYLGYLSSLDKVKGATFSQWAAVRGKLARIKLIVLREEGD